jgi:hypothetical protein
MQGWVELYLATIAAFCVIAVRKYFLRMARNESPTHLDTAFAKHKPIMGARSACDTNGAFG